MTDVYEESISTQLQGLVIIQRINVSFIQSSVVEEVITFAALDNVQVSAKLYPDYKLARLWLMKNGNQLHQYLQY